MIVGSHSIDLLSWANNPTEREILRYFLRSGTVLFVVIAGFMFQHLLYKYEFPNYLERRAKNVLLPYFLSSLPMIIVFATLIHRYDIDPGFYDKSVFYRIAAFYLTGSHASSLWFIPMIALYYVASPFLARLDQTRIVYFFIPGLMIPMALFAAGGGPLRNFVYFFPVYMLGMLLSRYKHAFFRFTDKHTLALTIAYLILIVSGTLAIDNRAVLYLSKVMTSVFLIVVFHRFENLLSLHGIRYLGSISFGIFFVHPYVIAAFRILKGADFGKPLPISGNLLLAAGVIAVVALLTVLCIWETRRILGQWSRPIIGC
jgi:hypothetical protein